MRRHALAAAALALGVAGVGTPDAAACGWLWACAPRAAPQAYYGYRPARGHLYRGTRGYRNGYGYTSTPASWWYLGTALPAARTDTVGLTPSVTTAQGLLHGALPARGPTLFGPGAAPVDWGNAYGSYYGDPAYGYNPFPSRSVPPRDTPSWWVEPRRRR